MAASPYGASGDITSKTSETRMAASPNGASGDITPKRPGTRPVQAARRPVQEPRRIAPYAVRSATFGAVGSDIDALNHSGDRGNRSYGLQDEPLNPGKHFYGMQNETANRGNRSYGLQDEPTNPGKHSYGMQNETANRGNRSLGPQDDPANPGKHSYGMQSEKADQGTKIYGLPEDETDSTRAFDRKRISVGYAPGQMKIDPRRMREAGREAYGREIYSREAHERGPYQEGRTGIRLPEDREPLPDDRHPGLWILTAVLLVIGLALIVLLSLPKNNSVRIKAADAVRVVTSPIENLVERKKQEPARIDGFTVSGNEKATAPADVLFSVTTGTAVDRLRLVDEDGVEVNTDLTRVENTDNNFWTLTFHVKDGYEGLVRLQAKRTDGTWVDTEYTAELKIAPPLAGSETPVPKETAAPDKGTEEVAGTAKAAAVSDKGSEETAGSAKETTEENEGREQSGETAEITGNTDGAGADAEDFGDEMWGVPWGGTPTPDPDSKPMATPAPTDTPEPTPEPTATPPLEAVADPDASPDLITNTIVYDGSKKVKDYMRAAKSLIHMPAGDDYTMKKIGVLTFRGNAFRQNAAVGEVDNPAGLAQIWQVEAGSSRGASQTFYGYEWTGQPAIVKWSTQVRAASNIDEDKKAKSALREVIIAGVDGVIRFIDLEDGVLTRGAINMGYPMRGTPSLHPAGYPYMNVGQYTRKMKNKTGKIGLRQYNLYDQKEITLIDGLDGKMHRGINKYGSFETSSLIDRTSDNMITLGTNGLLYLTSLNTEFDYQAGILKVSPGSIVMSSRAKGEKKDELVAVESSHAMYDRYVFYADMGGVLRCVDTNYLKPVWAVSTGDSVMAAVALDLNGDRGLDLYTANMLNNRKKGPAQIRRYDALSGKEIWTVEIGVAKNTKTKEDVGVKASPVIGQKGLGELVFFTVTGLDAEGRTMLGVGEETKAAIVAIEKETGKIRWSKGFGDRSESSPVAVYDKEGNGWIIQCVEDGTILLMDGLTGETKDELQIEGNIKASPAVYNDIMVIGTTGKGTEFVYGIRIQ
jgi:hypothetical protein